MNNFSHNQNGFAFSTAFSNNFTPLTDAGREGGRGRCRGSGEEGDGVGERCLEGREIRLFKIV